VSCVGGLTYDAEQSSLTVVLKAADPVTEQLLSHPLACSEQLYRLPVDAAIDPSLFHLVAALLARLLAVNERMQQENSAGPR